MLKTAFVLAAAAALAGSAQAATITGTFAAAQENVTSDTFGIQVGSTFTNSGVTVTSTTGEFSTIANGTSLTLSSVTALVGQAISFTSSFGNFMGSITNADQPTSAPNARVGVIARGTFTPIGSLSGFMPGLADLTLGYTQTGALVPGQPQPAISGSFTLASPSMMAAVPEPASWAMLITGFGMAGGALRRRKAAAAATA